MCIYDQLYVANYRLYFIILHRFEAFMTSSILRSKTIELMVNRFLTVGPVYQ